MSEGIEVSDSDLSRAFSKVINKLSAESESGTPDFILGEFLEGVLHMANDLITKRAEWRGKTVGLPIPSPTAEPADTIEKIVQGMVRGSVEAKEAHLLREFKSRPDLLRRIEDIVVEEYPTNFNVLVENVGDEANFITTYTWRIRMITDEERVDRYVHSEFKKFAATVPDGVSPEVELSMRARLTESAWKFIREGVKL